MTDKPEQKKASLLERAAKDLSKSRPLKEKSDRPDPSALSVEPSEAQSDLSSFRGLGAVKPVVGEDEVEVGKPTKAGAIERSQAPERDQSHEKKQATALEKEAAVENTNDVITEDNKVKYVEKRTTTQDIDLIALRDAGFITPDMPPNLMSEEFRIIKRSILLNAFAKGNENKTNKNIVLVTSSSPGEGKTFSAINLALSIATEQDVTVLLVDADFSKPEVLNRLGVAGGRGLMDSVADKEVDLGECLVRTSIPNLVLLPAGRQHNLTTELLASDRMEKMVNELSTRYKDRIIIFDSPPVLASSAASVLALYMGQTVFVIEAEKTTEPQIKESLNMISACENINLVLNKTHYSGSNKKFASYYGYGGR
jgi:receptor protein-tyrosine kinase